MNKHKTKRSGQIFMLFPSFGILLFTLLYFYAASMYPGGSQADLNSNGFDWVHNYWCNLMDKNAMNGQINPARNFAVIAMIILCCSLLVFFFQFARYLTRNITWKFTIRIFGSLSMIAAMLIFTNLHDLMIAVASILGVVVLIGIFISIFKSKLTYYKLSGIICIILLAANNFIYYTGHHLYYLPLIQKITFALVLAWIMGLNLLMFSQIFRKNEATS